VPSSWARLATVDGAWSATGWPPIVSERGRADDVKYAVNASRTRLVAQVKTDDSMRRTCAPVSRARSLPLRRGAVAIK
jgi:hypothetical protein